MDNINQEEKINYIYNYIKKEEKRKKYKLFLYLSVVFILVSYFVYIYFILIPSIKNSYKSLFDIWNLTNTKSWLNLGSSTFDELKNLLK